MTHPVLPSTSHFINRRDATLTLCSFPASCLLLPAMRPVSLGLLASLPHTALARASSLGAKTPAQKRSAPNEAERTEAARSHAQMRQWIAQTLNKSDCGLWMQRRIGGANEQVLPADCRWRLAGSSRINESGWARLCDFMRDSRNGRVMSMSVQLLDILFCLQRWAWHEGYRQPLVLTSGFRTSQSNQTTEGAVRDSLHLQGRAADIRCPGLDSLTLARMAVVLQMGGVGFYPGRDFVHIDDGPVRRWGRQAFTLMPV